MIFIITEFLTIQRSISFMMCVVFRYRYYIVIKFIYFLCRDICLVCLQAGNTNFYNIQYDVYKFNLKKLNIFFLGKKIRRHIVMLDLFEEINGYCLL